MRGKHMDKAYNIIDCVLLGLAAVFLISTMIRTGRIELINRARERAAAFVGGKLSVQDVMRAFGDWTEMDTAVAAVFNSFDESAEKSVAVNGETNRFEQDILTQQAVFFPNTGLCGGKSLRIRQENPLLPGSARRPNR